MNPPDTLRNKDVSLGIVKEGLRKHLKTMAKIAIALVVAFFIVQAVLQARDEFAQNQFRFSQVRWSWLVASGIIYLVGLLPMGFYWLAIMRALGQRPTIAEILRAYYIGHLGKYVPGKAMVVYLRTDLIRGSRVDTGLAAVSVFAETLTMMAVGAALSAGIVAIQFWHRKEMVLLAIGLMLAAGIPTAPPIFRMTVQWIQKRRGIAEIPLDGLTLKLMGLGLVSKCDQLVHAGVESLGDLARHPAVRDGDRTVGDAATSDRLCFPGDGSGFFVDDSWWCWPARVDSNRAIVGTVRKSYRHCVGNPATARLAAVRDSNFNYPIPNGAKAALTAACDPPSRLKRTTHAPVACHPCLQRRR